MKKKAASIVASILCIAMLLSLAACGGGQATGDTTSPGTTAPNTANSNSDSQIKSDEPIYLSDMLVDGGTRIWYRVESIGKDERVSAFVFENGEVTKYGNGIYLSGLTLGDVAKMTDEEIIELLEETERTWRAEIFARYDVSVISEELATASPCAYSLNVITDSTGNNTKSENIIYTYASDRPVAADSNAAVKAEDLFDINETTLKLSPAYRQGNVYESLFGGFVETNYNNYDGIFITRIPGGEALSPSPTLDTPQHPDVIVD